MIPSTHSGWRQLEVRSTDGAFHITADINDNVFASVKGQPVLSVVGGIHVKGPEFPLGVISNMRGRHLFSNQGFELAQYGTIYSSFVATCILRWSFRARYRRWAGVRQS